jgi:recombination protein RecA
LVEKAGSWYAYNGDKIGQGKSNACEYLRENPNVASEIEQKIRAQLMPIVEKKSKVEKDDSAKGKIET